MKANEYDKLTSAQRGWIIVAAVIGVFMQSMVCYGFGLLLHRLPH